MHRVIYLYLRIQCIRQITISRSYDVFLCHHPQTGGGQEPLGILLMGITGHGKSATGNAILGRDEFVSRGGMGSVTKTYNVGYTEFEGNKMKVVDIPGFEDTAEDTYERKVDLVCDALTRAIAKFPNGFHTVLLVVSYKQRMTSELKASIVSLVKLFDENAFLKNGILLVTGGDGFKRDFGRGSDVRAWINSAGNSANSWILDKCSDRCVLFDNITENECEMDSQRRDLLSVVGDVIRYSNTRYIPDICQIDQGDRDNMLRRKQKAVDDEQVGCLLGMMKDDLHKITKIYDRNLRMQKVSQLIEDARYIQNYPKTLPRGVPEKLAAFISMLEMIVQTDGLNSSTEGDLDTLITRMQEDLAAEEEKDGSWWKVIRRKVLNFVNSPIGNGIIRVFFGVIKIAGMFFGKII